jgi:RHS repeat-associated protein
VHYKYDVVTGLQTRTWTAADASTLDPDLSTSETQYVYDSRGRLDSVSQVRRNGSPVDVDSGTAGNQPEVTDYVYDLLGNLDQVRLPDGVVSDYDYDNLNRLAQLREFKDGPGSVHQNQYEDGVDILLAEYDYDLLADGKRSGVTEQVDDDGDPETALKTTRIDWLYDNLGRLSREVYDGYGTDLDFVADYTLDLVGNRVTKKTDATPSVAEMSSYHAAAVAGTASALVEVNEEIDSAYDANDRLLTEARDVDGTPADTTLYEYGPNADPAGGYGGDSTQQTRKTVWQGTDTDPETGAKLSDTIYQYNLQGQMSESSVDADGDGEGAAVVTEYKYDADGLRVSQTEDSVETKYLNDQQNPTGYSQVLEEKDAAGDIMKSYALGLDIISQQAPGVQSGGTLYLLKDGHGSTRGLVDAIGQPVSGQVYRYDAFGNRLDSTSALTTILYSGEQTDATGLQYLRARYYDPTTGRFNRLDPFAGNGNDPLSLHRYIYVDADPVNAIDPSGLFPGFPWPRLFPGAPLPDEIQIPVLGTLVHSYLGEQFRSWADARGLKSWANQENRTIVWDITRTNYPRQQPYSFKPDLVSWVPGGTSVDLYEMKHADIILDAPSYLGASLFATAQLARKGFSPLSAMAPRLAVGFGTAFASGYNVWPDFRYSPPFWELVTWTDYARFPGVILYDWVPTKLGVYLATLATMDAILSAYVIESLEAYCTAVVAGAQGSDLVNAVNYTQGLPATAPPSRVWYAMAASIGLMTLLGGSGLSG